MIIGAISWLETVKRQNCGGDATLEEEDVPRKRRARGVGPGLLRPSVSGQVSGPLIT